MRRYLGGLHIVGKVFIVIWLLGMISGVVWKFALNPDSVTIENAAIFLAILSLPVALLPKINEFFKKERDE